MVKSSALLGQNSRYMLFSLKYNTRKGKTIASSKLRTKKYLGEEGINVPERYAIFQSLQELSSFDWSKLPSSFALKPNKGLGGEGIMIVKKKTKDGQGWITSKRSRVTPTDLQLHVQDILEGAYSLRNDPDIAYVEEFVGRHKAFRKYAYRGTPDIRVIVFNKVPVMAMLRLPTKESGGRANLHQGAIAVGIDIATGITTRAYWRGDYIKYKPSTKRKLHGLRIPNWTNIMTTAVKCSIVTTLGYIGVDIVLHPLKGPMVLELNYMPGLQIQMVNKAGLKKRLERVEDLDVRDEDHGVKIAKALFAASFSDRVKAKEGVRTITAIEEIKIKGLSHKKQRKKVMAKIDTGAWRTSISKKLAEDLGLLDPSNVLWTKNVRSSLGLQERPIINFTFWLGGRKITTAASVAKRMSLKFPVIIGRKNLKGYLVDPHLKPSEKREKVEKAKEDR